MTNTTLERPTSTQITPIDAPLSMSSLEIAKLTGKSHKHVIRDIEAMIAAIEEDGPNLDHQAKSNGYRYERDRRGYVVVIHLDRSHTYTLMTGYDAKARKKVVDRWLELEGGTSPAPKAPTNMREALLLALEQQEQIEAKDKELAAVRPKAEALDELATLEGTFGLREAAKLCGWPEGKFIQRLHEMRWIFKQEPTKPWQAHADRLREGVLAHKTYEQTKPNGDVSARYQVMVTAKGLTKLATVLGTIPEGKRAVPFAPKREAAA